MRYHSTTWLALLLFVAAGCFPARGDRSPGDPGEQRQEVDGRKLLGLTVAKAVQQVGINPADCQFDAEPPGVGRFVSGKTSDGTIVRLKIARHPNMFRMNYDWTFEMFAEKQVVEVEVEKDGRRETWPKQ